MNDTKRVIVIGDVHGCLNELDELLRTLQYHPERDRLILVGDIVDRGPEPIGVCARVREIGAEVLLGNHEEKHIRMALRDAEQRATGKPNAMRPYDEKRRAQHERLLALGYIEWFATLPRFLRFTWVRKPWVVVHGGLEPHLPIEQQKPNVLIRCRYIKPDGKMLGSMDQAPDTVFWPERWRGPESVVYGHITYDLKRIRMSEVLTDDGYVRTYGIDTGCGYGGRLTAFVAEPDAMFPTYVQVQAEEVHGTWHGPDGGPGRDE